MGRLCTLPEEVIFKERISMHRSVGKLSKQRERHREEPGGGNDFNREGGYLELRDQQTEVGS